MTDKEKISYHCGRRGFLPEADSSAVVGLFMTSYKATAKTKEPCAILRLAEYELQLHDWSGDKKVTKWYCAETDVCMY